MAAAGVYALENNVERLREDHDNAARFADLFRGCRGLAVDYDAAAGTNLLYVHCPGGAVDPLELLRRLEEVRLLILSHHFIDKCNHKDFIKCSGQVTESEVAALGHGTSLMAITMTPTTIR